jgi:hypothetical protein
MLNIFIERAYCKTAPWPHKYSPLHLSKVEKKFYLAEDITSTHTSFRSKGGVLADEMGLGKTAEGN